jgi:phenylacetic acid degradation operon negative regulatory protein
VLLSALLGETPPAMPVRRLVRIADLFGINENQARVALSRMVARGEVLVDEQGDHALTGRLLDRSRRLGRARSAATEPYDGTWHLVVVTASGDGAATRRERRGAMREARLGELREGVWMRPANLNVELGLALEGAVSSFRGVPATEPIVLARSVFDLAGWERRGWHLCQVLDRLERGALHSLADGFELNAEVLRHLQRDPLVPRELLGGAWPGHELREHYERFDARYRAQLADAHRAARASTSRD